MPVTIPFNFVKKRTSPLKITQGYEDTFWINAGDTLNSLVYRCNAAKGTSIIPVSLRSTLSLSKPLSAEDYDYNLAEFERASNAIMVACESTGLNPLNPVKFFKRGESEFPLFVYQRDANCGIIKVFLTSTAYLFDWAGI